MSNRFFSLMLTVALVVGIAACGGDDNAADADLTPDAPGPKGVMSLMWTINGADATSTTCGDVGAQLVEIDMVPSGELAGETDVPNCSAGSATTHAVNVGTYDVTIDLLDTTAHSLLDQPFRQFGVGVQEDLTTALDPIDFVL
jgi:hypothetical protein